MRYLLVAATALLIWAAPGQAVTYKATMNGVLTEQINPGVDPLFQVGDVIRFEAVYSDDFVIPDYQGTGPLVALGNLPLSGDLHFFMAGNQSVWLTPNFRDVIPVPGYTTPTNYFRPTFRPSADGTKITEWSGIWQPTNTTTTPVMNIFQDGTFVLSSGGGYGNYTVTLGFRGYWDFANSHIEVLDAVPEPKTWALMLLGFAAVGAISRRPHRQIARAVPPV